MSIHGITNLNQYAAAQMTKTQFQNQAGTSAAANAKSKTTSSEATQTTQTAKSTPSGIDTSRILSIPNVAQYEELIGRFLSGESEMESAGKPLTEDQIALRQLMRTYRSTDTRTVGQMQSDMQTASKNFLEYWKANGNGNPPPARMIAPDGSFQILNSKDDLRTAINRETMGLLEKIMSVIQSQKSSSNSDAGKNIDMKV